MQLTKSEIVKIISAIKVQCPEALPYKDKSEFATLVDMWFDCFKEYPKEVVWEAVRSALKNTVFQKQNWLGAINQEIEKLHSAYEKSNEELWAELTGTFRDVRDCAYMFKFNFVESNGLTQGENAKIRLKGIYDNLSPELKEYVRNENVFIELANLEDDQLTFEKGRFIREMPILKERARVRQSTPENLAGLIQGLSNKLRLESWEEKNNEKLL